jgi:hypothetical protein
MLCIIIMIYSNLHNNNFQCENGLTPFFSKMEMKQMLLYELHYIFKFMV